MAVYFIMIAAMLTQDYTSQGIPLEQFQFAYLGIQLNKLTQENNHLRAEQQQDAIKIASLEDEISRLKEQLQLAQQRHFGKKHDTGESPVNPELLENTYQAVAAYSR